MTHGHQRTRRKHVGHSGHTLLVACMLLLVAWRRQAAGLRLVVAGCVCLGGKGVAAGPLPAPGAPVRVPVMIQLGIVACAADAHEAVRTETARGTPVGATAGAAELFAESALIVENPEDHSGFAKALDSLCDPQTRASLAQRGHAVATAHSWQHQTERLRALYRQLVDES